MAYGAVGTTLRSWPTVVLVFELQLKPRKFDALARTQWSWGAKHDA